MKTTRNIKKTKTRKTKSRKIYKMRGCSRLGKRKQYKGGLAYTGEKIQTQSNPFLAYVGGGTNANAYPAKGPVSNGENTIFNNASQQRGGSGSPWTSNPSTWPGVNGSSGNYLAYNNYNTDISRQMMTNPPIKGGTRRRQCAGGMSNLLSQDLVNLGRQFQFGVHSAYNGLAGVASPVNPLPWKGQFNTPSSIAASI